jgi:hypothetical protein
MATRVPSFAKAGIALGVLATAAVLSVRFALDSAEPVLTGGIPLYGQVRGLDSLSGVTLMVSSGPRGRRQPVNLQIDGRFRTEVAVPGQYAIEVRTSEFLASARRLCTVTDGGGECNLHLPPTRIELSVAGIESTHKAVGFYVSGPVSPTDHQVTGFVPVPQAQAFPLVGVEYGRFAIFAYTADGLVSSQPVKVALTPTEPSVRGTLQLVRRRLTLRVQNAEGTLIDGAMVRTALKGLPGGRGTFDASAAPSGMTLQIQAVGYLPSCQHLSASEDQQEVALQRLSRLRTYINLIPNPGSPRGIIEGLPGSTCGVDVSGFRLDRDGDGGLEGLRFGIVGLPRGRFRYRAAPGAELVTISAPHEGITYRIPPECLTCM